MSRLRSRHLSSLTTSAGVFLSFILPVDGDYPLPIQTGFFSVQTLSLPSTQHGGFNREYWRSIDSDLDESQAPQKLSHPLGFHPLVILNDARVLKLFTHILHQRLDTSLFCDYYQLGAGTEIFKWRGNTVSKQILAEMILDFLVAHSDAEPMSVARRFWKIFDFDGHPGEPAELRSVQSIYDLMRDQYLTQHLIRDVLPNGGVVADIGAGKNGLGRVVLDLSDREGLDVQRVIAVDIVDWTAPVAKPDARLEFRLQQGSELPLEPNSIDIAICKWSLHHMDVETQSQQLRQIVTALKPGGRLVVIEALRTSELEAMPLLQRSVANGILWPSGPWFDSHYQFIIDYLRLPLEIQRAFLALEDFYGHILVRQRLWMPLPFTYHTVSELQALGESIGLREVVNMREVYGLSPIFLRAPPTVRLVFQKPIPDYSRLSNVSV
jgi:ubiquinone/menaquinone biosynthesis C-methylase UbiE